MGIVCDNGDFQEEHELDYENSQARHSAGLAGPVTVSPVHARVNAPFQPRSVPLPRAFLTRPAENN
jgi:hypothetical protein